MRSILTIAALVLVATGSALAQDPVYKIGDGVKAPVLTREVKPSYTEGALRRRVQGTVETSSVVLADGTVGDVSVTRSLDIELDAEAIRAVKQWQFKPGTKDDRPVPVEVHIEVTFTLRDAPVVYRVGPGVTAPVVVKQVQPDYPEEARQARLQGSVAMDGVIETDGSITGILVIKSSDARFDRAAVKALGQWQFKPGMKDDAPVRVQVRIEMEFHLR
jgi:TonB family protein